MKYEAKFTGRTIGAIGSFYPIKTTVEGANLKAVRLALYDRYDHIQGLKLRVIKAAPARRNKAMEKAQQHLIHFQKCEALASRCGVEKPNGEAISRALARLENVTCRAAVAQCNGEDYQGQPFRQEEDWEAFKDNIKAKIAALFGGSVPPGFFINSDPRGYALKIDNEHPRGLALIRELKLHTDWGGYGILSP